MNGSGHIAIVAKYIPAVIKVNHRKKAIYKFDS